MNNNLSKEQLEIKETLERIINLLIDILRRVLSQRKT